ncbi:hypothetical protein ACFWA9_04740 [Kitasatospora sp. NPDC059973]|uniref:hypothetical protein n=1 Tax=Kitasatospora sp. NPDC059973 TaxID=3347020 RepID=UPI0036C9CC24
MSDAVLEAVAGAATVGERTAVWVETLAARQDDQRHRRVLELFAEAVRQVLGREIIPNGEGEVGEELRYRLDAHVVLGAPGTGCAPELSTAEQLALAVAGAAVSAPATILGDIELDLPALCSVIESALVLAEA